MNETRRVYAPPGTRSKFYGNDQAGPDAARLLLEYGGAHHAPDLRPGDLAVYENPSWRQPDGTYKTGGMDGTYVVTEIVDLGGSTPPQAILDDGEWEVSADNLRCVSRPRTPEEGSRLRAELAAVPGNARNGAHHDPYAT